MDVHTAERLADEADLIRLPPDEPGIRRVRCGRGFSYRDPAGVRVRDAERERIRALVIPPAWEDVWIAPRPDSHLLATGVDEAGRKQYLYHPRWREAADRWKFGRLAAFGQSLVALRRRVVSDLRSHDTSTAHCAALVRLLDAALIRPGGRDDIRDDIGEAESFGATTLLASHVEVDGTGIRLAFPGKSGVEHDLSVDDRLLAGYIRRLMADIDDSSHLFVDDEGHPVEPDDLNAYLADVIGPFTAKDFRTWGATCTVTEHLARPGDGHRDDGDAPDDDGDVPADADAEVRRAIAAAAEALGNTPAVCRSSYVAPAVIDAFCDGSLAAAWASSRSSRWMTRAERTTCKLLAT